LLGYSFFSNASNDVLCELHINLRGFTSKLSRHVRRIDPPRGLPYAIQAGKLTKRIETAKKILTQSYSGVGGDFDQFVHKVQAKNPEISRKLIQERLMYGNESGLYCSRGGCIDYNDNFNICVQTVSLEKDLLADVADAAASNWESPESAQSEADSKSLTELSHSNVDDTQCEKKLVKLDELLGGYTGFASANKSSVTRGIFTQIKTLIFEQTRAEGSCQNDLMVRYLVDSINIAQSTASSTKSNNESSLYSLFSSATRISSLITGLYHQNKLQFVTENFRKKSGGHWLDRGNDGNYSVLGGYDCGTSTVYIDPNLHPLDEAITAFHELDHFIRDKTTQAVDPIFVKNEKIDWSAYNLNDEVSSITYSAAAQADLQGVYGRSIRKHPFDVADDLSLFSRQGLFYQIFKSNEEPMCGRGAGYKMLGVITTAGMCYLPNAYGSHTHISDTDLAAELYTNQVHNDKYSKIREIIWKSYFEGTTTTSELPPQSDNRDTHHGYNLISWLSSNNNQDDSLIESAKMSSTVCKLYQADMNTGAVTHYLGSQFEASEHSAMKPCLRFSDKL